MDILRHLEVTNLRFFLAVTFSEVTAKMLQQGRFMLT